MRLIWGIESMGGSMKIKGVVRTQLDFCTLLRTVGHVVLLVLPQTVKEGLSSFPIGCRVARVVVQLPRDKLGPCTGSESVDHWQSNCVDLEEIDLSHHTCSSHAHHMLTESSVDFVLALVHPSQCMTVIQPLISDPVTHQ